MTTRTSECPVHGSLRPDPFETKVGLPHTFGYQRIKRSMIQPVSTWESPEGRTITVEDGRPIRVAVKTFLSTDPYYRCTCHRKD